MITDDSLKVALREILGNAISFSNKSKEKVIYVKASQVKNNIKIEIENTGEHIPNNLLPNKIFFDGVSTREKDGGMGQGLYIAWLKITENLGTLSAENTKKGVKFIITIPIIKDMSKVETLSPNRDQNIAA